MNRLLALVLLAGCAGGSERPRAAVADSAGVRIVSNGPLTDAAVRIDGEPVARVGWAPGGLEFAEVTAGAFLGDSSVVVFDGGDQTLHILSPTGVPLARVGRSGDGPGEFRAGEAVEVLAGDTLVVFDEGASRISLFDREGAFLESALWERPPRFGVRPSAVTASGSLVWVPFAFVPYRTDEPGTRWVNGPLLVSSRLGAEADTVARVPMFEFPLRGGIHLSAVTTRCRGAESAAFSQPSGWP
jgi:hypothetical protein